MSLCTSVLFSNLTGVSWCLLDSVSCSCFVSTEIWSFLSIEWRWWHSCDDGFQSQKCILMIVIFPFFLVAPRRQYSGLLLNLYFSKRFEMFPLECLNLCLLKTTANLFKVSGVVLFGNSHFSARSVFSSWISKSAHPKSVLSSWKIEISPKDSDLLNFVF